MGCHLPETKYSIKNGTVWHRCAACGAKEMVDMNHKLTNYILAQDKKDKNKIKKEGGKKKGKDDSDEDKDKKKKDKKKKEKKEKKSKKDKKDLSGDSDGKEKSYLKEAMFGKKDGAIISDDDDDDAASEAGVDDEGAMLLAVEGT